jgi:uncharacterized protein
VIPAPARFVAAMVVLAALAAPARATPTTAHPIEDAARVVRDADEQALEDELRTLRAEGVALGVMIVDTTGGASIESFARAHRAEWATGEARAALFVLAIRDRRSRLEVNDALRGAFPDARAQAILDHLKGYLRGADYPGAIRAVIREVRNSAAGVAPDLESPHPQSVEPAPVEPAPVEPVPVEPAPAPAHHYERPVDIGNYVAIGTAILAFVLGAWLWARSRVAARATFNGGAPLGRSVWLETLVCMGLIVAGIFYVALIVFAATSSSSSSSSSSWGSSSTSFGGGSSSGGSSSGGGWSGGGASSSW